MRRAALVLLPARLTRGSIFVFVQIVVVITRNKMRQKLHQRKRFMCILWRCWRYFWRV